MIFGTRDKLRTNVGLSVSLLHQQVVFQVSSPILSEVWSHSPERRKRGMLLYVARENKHCCDATMYSFSQHWKPHAGHTNFSDLHPRFDPLD